MKYFFLIIIIFISCKTIDWQSQEVTARKDRKGDLIGVVNKKTFQEKDYASNFNYFYKDYETNKILTTKLEPLLKNIKIIIFMGTWCDDSQREIPNFCKVLDEVKFDEKRLKIIALNKKKKAKGLERGFNIERIPTFIVYRNNKEIGRITECAEDNSTLEQDLLYIVSNRYSYDYHNNY